MGTPVSDGSEAPYRSNLACIRIVTQLGTRLSRVLQPTTYPWRWSDSFSKRCPAASPRSMSRAAPRSSASSHGAQRPHIVHDLDVERELMRSWTPVPLPSAGRRTLVDPNEDPVQESLRLPARPERASCAYRCGRVRGGEDADRDACGRSGAAVERQCQVPGGGFSLTAPGCIGSEERRNAGVGRTLVPNGGVTVERP